MKPVKIERRVMMGNSYLKYLKGEQKFCVFMGRLA